MAEQLSPCVARVFTRDVLRLAAREWNAFREKQGTLSDSDEKILQALRRKSMACVYAERSRDKRRRELQESLERAQGFERMARELQAENAALRRRVEVLETELTLRML